MFKHILTVCALCLIAACSTPYQEMGVTGGVTATKITETDYQIVSSVNGYTDRAVAEQYALLKAAETTYQAGYDHFIIVGQDKDTRRQYMGWNNVTEFPRVDYRIRLAKGRAPVNNPQAYNAVELINNIGGKVQRPGISTSASASTSAQ